jgi:hypothetical protein
MRGAGIVNVKVHRLVAWIVLFAALAAISGQMVLQISERSRVKSPGARKIATTTHVIRRSRVQHAVAPAAVSTVPAAAPASGGEAEGVVDFERHVMGLLGKMGCDAGSCHGSFQGKGGLRLSLFGHDPEVDYRALTRDAMGRRINVFDPDRSLILLKATGRLDHGGGRRFPEDSWQYRALRSWIAGGCERQKGSGTVESVAVLPLEARFRKIGETVRLSVRARFADGSEEDVTRYSGFRSNDEAVAEVDATGRAKGLRPGDTAIVASYRGFVVAVRALVPFESPPEAVYPDVPEVNFIDRDVFAKLKGLNIEPSGLADDAEFLRRVTIDTIGTLPSPGEVRSFLADTGPQKRAGKIEQLLAHPLHAALWATKLCDMTGNDTEALEPPRERRSQMWHDWFRKRVAEDRPYDEIVRDILCATSRGGQSLEDWCDRVQAVEDAARRGFDTTYAENPHLDLFWRREQRAVPIEQWGERVATAFLGVRLACAQCHKHPYDRWTQADYRAFANIFSRVTYEIPPEAKKIVDETNLRRRLTYAKTGKKQPLMSLAPGVYIDPRSGRSLPDPDTNQPLPPKALGGPVLPGGTDRDPRVELFRWLGAPDNPFFARSFVNRVWGYYLGTGLVEPVDDFSTANPPSNEKLLDALAREFVAHGFRLRHLERAILNSRAYQLSSVTNPSNRWDRTGYSHNYPRPMMAEAVIDAVGAALDMPETFGPDARSGSRAIEVGASRVRDLNLAYALRTFGRPERSVPCDCERTKGPALPQSLYLMADPELLDRLGSSRGRLARLLKSSMTDDRVLEELFLATVSRPPGEADRRLFDACLARRGDRRAAFVDTLWALINSSEFLLNH